MRYIALTMPYFHLFPFFAASASRHRHIRFDVSSPPSSQQFFPFPSSFHHTEFPGSSAITTDIQVESLKKSGSTMAVTWHNVSFHFFSLSCSSFTFREEFSFFQHIPPVLHVFFFHRQRQRSLNFSFFQNSPTEMLKTPTHAPGQTQNVSGVGARFMRGRALQKVYAQEKGRCHAHSNARYPVRMVGTGGRHQRQTSRNLIPHSSVTMSTSTNRSAKPTTQHHTREV